MLTFLSSQQLLYYHRLIPISATCINIIYTATEENVADRMSKFGPLVESTIPTVIVTLENNRNQNNAKESLADEEEYKKEEKNDNVKEKRILKSNEKLRSRG